jgi:hypothetical protein
MVRLTWGSLFGLSESIALAVGFYNVDSMGKAVEQCPGEALGPEYLGPVFEWEIGSKHEALTLVGSADYFKEQFCTCLGKRYVPQFV